MVLLDENNEFPSPETADPHGLLAMGGDLSVERLIKAYYAGIFPWFDDSQPILWWSPNPRMVLFPEKLHISKSMKQLLNRQKFEVTFNQKFEEVIVNCSTVGRKEAAGTWITDDMILAYNKLHALGYAKSVEVWQKDVLVGGLYGVYLKDKKVFCGESMFSYQSNASKYGFITWIKKLLTEDIRLIDCQVYSKHLESLGAEEIDRQEFLRYLT